MCLIIPLKPQSRILGYVWLFLIIDELGDNHLVLDDFQLYISGLYVVNFVLQATHEGTIPAVFSDRQTYFATI